ncbi:MAG: ankyrin repeat domain-containing protein [Synechococcus sp. SB0665_bin_28]|nr:ankyrin repeat domain-containing protein [Synechococcus sp. SB0665_bin_28]MYF19817.1 ankyrin repeat domain-containing protein [Synechococcus sp. SB0677_bin_5]
MAHGATAVVGQRSYRLLRLGGMDRGQASSRQRSQQPQWWRADGRALLREWVGHGSAGDGREAGGLIHRFTPRANFREPGKCHGPWGIKVCCQASREAKALFPGIVNGIEGVLELAESLLQAGSKMTALTDAARKGDTVVIRAFIAAGANVNFTEDGANPLHHAARRDHTDIVKLLIAAGTDVNAHGNTRFADASLKDSPLYSAARGEGIQTLPKLSSPAAMILMLRIIISALLCTPQP